jgi:hypothetical protein
MSSMLNIEGRGEDNREHNNIGPREGDNHLPVSGVVREQPFPDTNSRGEYSLFMDL